MVKILSGGAGIDARDQRGRSALLARPTRNRVEVARFTHSGEGAGRRQRQKDFVQDRPYLYAAAEGRVEILKLTLAAGASTSKTPTAIAAPAHSGGAPYVHVEAVKLLLATAIDKDHVNN